MSGGDPRVPAVPGDGEAIAVGASASASARRIILIRLGSLAIVFVGSIVLARTLGPERRGAHAFYVALTVLMTAILGLSAPTGGYVLATRRGEPIRELAANALWLALAAGLVATSVTLALQATFRILPEPLAHLPAWPLLVMVGVTGLAGNAHQLQLALAQRRAIAGAVLSFGPYTIAAFGYLLVPLASDALSAALWIFALSSWVVAIVAGLVRPPLSVVAIGRPRLGLAIRSVRQGLRTYPGELAGMLHQRADVLLLGILAPAAAVGIYVVAYQSVEPILLLATASAATILALGHGDHAVESGEVTARLMRETLLIGSLLAIAAAAFAPVLVPLVYGAAFAESIVPLVILLPGIVALSVARVAMSDLTRRNLLERLAAISVLTAGLNLVLNLVLIPIAGPIGAALASLGSYLVLAGLAISLDRRASGFALHALVPTRADVGDLVRAWSPVASLRPERRSPPTSGGA